VLEALCKGLITGGQPARKLKEQPAMIKGLQESNRLVQQIPQPWSEPARPFAYRKG
jgi:hypothetical protein